LDLRLASAKQGALDTVLRVEGLEDAGRKGTPEWDSAARLAVTAQRIVKALQASREGQALARAPLPQEEKARAALEGKRAAAATKAAQTSAALLDFPSTAYEPRPVTIYPQTSTGRRLAFARWLADKSNPLTARVAMNHVWLRHFGQGLEPSVF